MQELNDLDAQILKFICDEDNGALTLYYLSKKLPAISSMQLRMEGLEREKYIRRDAKELKNGALVTIEKLDTYHITDLGKMRLQNHEHSARKHLRDLWLKNAWIPIIVSFVTTVSTNYIIPRLPEMLEWCRRIFARIFS